MKRNILSLLLVAFVAVSFVACNEGTADEQSAATDTTPVATEVSAEAPAAADNATAPDAPAAATDAAATAESEEEDVPKTTMSFEGETHDFGDINEGDKVKHIFKFTNTGAEPLIINSAKGSCGCTVPEWPKEPIPPGQAGEILVEFNSKGKKNKQTKTVTINANTDPNPTRLTIKANVAPLEAPAVAPES